MNSDILLCILFGLSAISIAVVAVFADLKHRDLVRTYKEAFEDLDDMALIDLIDRLEGDYFRKEYRSAAKSELIRRSKDKK